VRRPGRQRDLHGSAILGLGMTRALLIVLLVPLALSAQAPASPESLARALQTRYQGVRDFSADFTQTYRGGVLKTTQTKERGTVAVKKPGLMKWIYTSPERKELVSDGKKIYWYIPEDKQVTVSDLPAGEQASTPLLFLSGRGDLARDFTASTAPTAVPGAVGLKLVPRRPEPEYEYFVVSVHPASLQIQALTTRDRQGGESTLIFANMKENKGISDKDFVFNRPRGVSVITDAQSN
jgi:outer membrane lipoprotein carrier protein